MEEEPATAVAAGKAKRGYFFEDVRLTSSSFLQICHYGIIEYRDGLTVLIQSVYVKEEPAVDAAPADKAKRGFFFEDVKTPHLFFSPSDVFRKPIWDGIYKPS